MNNITEQQTEIFSGSYSPEDCEFLLQTTEITPLSISEKERLLQRGGIHYSKMITAEEVPTQAYLDTFKALVAQYADRLAEEVKLLAKKLYQQKGDHITLVSLARAGTPIGVLITRALKAYYTQDVKHYSISIIRDRGIDCAALEHISNSGRASNSIVFVDGWTAKGVINRELKSAIYDWNRKSDYCIGDELCVISDLSGSAEYIATTDDYAIPSGVLNSTVSGLVSRTMMLDDVEGYHQCIVYEHLAKHDLTHWFVDRIVSRFESVGIAMDNSTQAWRKSRQENLSVFLSKVIEKFNVDDINKIKPGVAEATRVMLRRIPRILIVKDSCDPDVRHLKVLASEKEITVLEDPTMPFSAMAIIANIKD
ncbi:cysteine protease StiP family protein [Shewanella sp. VB17]|uniref:cysteine protease StiP family protein n=1 Tax=Shewanella sp. VB17 TaxID=2739432 RepID=UPI001565C408|nr:cysteine protease StiP family protein [Shewanella sp. VB17]NRD72865.1 cysteine protease StiP family protein [Shewanella sp. VB17]